MIQLPVELQEAIVSCCDRTDQLSLRLTCTSLANLCAAPLFEEFSICYFEFSIDNLLSLGNLTRFVKRLIVYTDGLIDMTDLESLKDHVRRRYAADEHETIMMRLHLVAGEDRTTWQLYRDLLQQRRHLLTGLLRLPAIQEVQIKHFACGPSYPDDRAAASWPKPSLNMVRDLGFWLRDAALDDDPWIVGRVLDALHTPRVIDLRTITRDRMLPIKDANVLTELRSLVIRPVGWHQPHPDIESDITLLAQREKLSQLSISYTTMFPPLRASMRDHSPISKLFSQAVWPSLRTLSISMNILNCDFTAFMKSHSGLKSLTIEHCCIGDAQEIFNTIPSLLRLDLIYLADLYSWDDYERSDDHDTCYFFKGAMTSHERHWLLGLSSDRPIWQSHDVVHSLSDDQEWR